MSESTYYPYATELFNNITMLHPNSQIWLTGHSLGGQFHFILPSRIVMTMYIIRCYRQSVGDNVWRPGDYVSRSSGPVASEKITFTPPTE
jgi:hypothetical protein